MLRQLTLINIKGLIGRKASNGKKKFRMPTWLVVVLIGVLLVASFFTMFYEFAKSFYSAAMGWMYFSILGTMTFGFMLMTNIAMAEGQLFESKYNDMLLSMPIKSHHILLSRLIAMLMYDYFIQATMLIPALAAWIMASGKFGAFFINALIVSIFWPLLTLAIGAIVGFGLYRVFARSTHKNLLKIIMTFGMIGLYYYFTFKMEMAMAEGGDLAPIGNALGKLKFTEWYGKGIMHTNVKYMLLIIGIAVAAIALVFVIVNRFYIKAITINGVVVAKRTYKEKPVRERSVMAALWSRELKRFGAYFTYLINNLMGIIMVLAFAVFMIIKGGSLFKELVDLTQGERELVTGLVAGGGMAAGCFMCCTFGVSGSSISLEGPCLDHLKSLPIRTRDIINSKLLFHYSLMAPAILILSVVFCVVCRFDWKLAACCILLPQAFLIFSDMLGMLVGLFYPKLNWTNEAEVVKRSMAVMVQMFGSMAVLGIGIAAYFLFAAEHIQMDTYYMISTAALFVLAAILYYVIMHFGARKYEKLGG